MNSLLKLKKELEVSFLKSKTYEEINDMFCELNDKANAEISSLQAEIGRLKKEIEVIRYGFRKHDECNDFIINPNENT